jgi:hypothetical protein
VEIRIPVQMPYLGIRHKSRWRKSPRSLKGPVALRVISMEARVGIEPTHKGFADLSLTTWVPRLNLSIIAKTRLVRKRGVPLAARLFQATFS